MGWLFPLYLGACAYSFGVFAAEARTWWSVHEMRRALGAAEGSAVAHWAGPDAAKPCAAFLAVKPPGAGVRSIVALGGQGAKVRFDGRTRVEGPGEVHPITSLDLDGVRVREWVVLFHSEAGLLRSAFSFDTGSKEGSAPAEMRYVVTGVAPGVWEVWRDGWVVDIGVVVRAGEGVLHFTERPGSFFIRRLN